MQNKVRFNGLWKYDLPKTGYQSRKKLEEFRQKKAEGLIPHGKRSREAAIRRMFRRKLMRANRAFVRHNFRAVTSDIVRSAIDRIYSNLEVCPGMGKAADLAGKRALACIEEFKRAPVKKRTEFSDWDANIKRRGIYVPPGIYAAAKAAREKRSKPLYDQTSRLPPIGRVIRDMGPGKDNVYINVVGGRIVGPMRPANIPAGHHKKYWYFLRTRGTWYTSEHHPYPDEPEIYAISDIPKE